MTPAMKVPRDQALFFTVFLSVCFGLTLVMWIALPVVHLGEDEGGGKAKRRIHVLTPEESIKKSEQIISRAEAVLARVEEKEKEPGAIKGKVPAKNAPKSPLIPEKPAEQAPAKH